MHHMKIWQKEMITSYEPSFINALFFNIIFRLTADTNEMLILSGMIVV